MPRRRRASRSIWTPRTIRSTGHQEGRFFHGFYDGYCYLPLYVFCGEHLLAAKLRRSNIDASAGATEEIGPHRHTHPRALAKGAHPAARRQRLRREGR